MSVGFSVCLRAICYIACVSTQLETQKAPFCYFYFLGTFLSFFKAFDDAIASEKQTSKHTKKVSHEDDYDDDEW